MPLEVTLRKPTKVKIVIKKCMFKIIIKRIKRFFFRLKNSDAFYHCPVWKNEGCSHVDGLICNFPNCTTLHEYMGHDFVFCPDCKDFHDCISGHFGLGCYNGKKLDCNKEVI
jgi:hypothetical protein